MLNSLKYYFFILFIVFSKVQAVDLVTVLYKDNEFFEIKGNYYYFDNKDIPFSIASGETLLLLDEQKHSIGTDSYFNTISLADESNDKRCEFRSLVIGGKSNKITNIKEKSRNIKKGIYVKERYRCNFDARCEDKQPCWDVHVIYDVIFDDTTSYELITRIREYSEKDAKDRLNDFPPVKEEDELIWGEEETNANQLDLHHFQYGAKIVHNSNPIKLDEATLIGNKRKVKQYKVHIEHDINDKKFFRVRNHYFPITPEAKDLYPSWLCTVASEQYIPQLENSYYVTIGLISSQTQKIHYFDSILHDDNESSEIDHVVENGRQLVRYVGLDDDDWAVEYDLTVTLKDGSVYSVVASVLQSNKRKAKAETKKSGLCLQKGDEIVWGRSWHLYGCDVDRVEFNYAKIRRNGKKKDFYRLNVQGPERKSYSLDQYALIEPQW